MGVRGGIIMAKESGWWELTTTIELDDIDLDHIVEMIKQGYTSGEICEDEKEVL
jgi:hypothetical protein